MRIFNKIVGSKTAPENTNDVWFDGNNFKVCINTEWVTVGNTGSVPTVTTNLFEIVSKLPESGNKDKIYLVPSENEEEGNKWIEWAYINSTWEQLGPSKLTDGESYDDSEIRELLDSKLESEVFLGTSIEGISAPYISYNPQQLTEEQKNVARSNLGMDTIDAKLTELSAEVSGLSERVDALGEGDSSVFEAVYGETTYNEIIEAHNEGKIVICEYDVWVCRLTKIQASQVMLQASAETSVTRLVCKSNGQWANATYSTYHNLKTLDNGNCEITIAARTAEVATPQYVENLLGVIINGDY